MADRIADAIRPTTSDPSAHLNKLLSLRRLDPAYRACLGDGSTINVHYGQKAMREEIAPACESVERQPLTPSHLAAAASNSSRCRISSTEASTCRSACCICLAR